MDENELKRQLAEIDEVLDECQRLMLPLLPPIALPLPHMPSRRQSAADWLAAHPSDGKEGPTRGGG